MNPSSMYEDSESDIMVGSGYSSSNASITSNNKQQMDRQQRRRMRRQQQKHEHHQNPKGSNHSGDESTNSSNKYNKHAGKQKDATTLLAAVGSGNSMIWALLFIGLLFCLLDIGYMMGRLEMHPSSSLNDNSNEEQQLENQQKERERKEQEQLQLPKLQQEQIQKQEQLIKQQEQQRKQLEKELQQLKRKNQQPNQQHQQGLQHVQQEQQGQNAEIPQGTNYLEEQADSVDYDSKKFVIDLIKDSGVGYIDYRTYKSLPTWQDIVELYGDKPIVYGLEQCEVFQKSNDLAELFVGTAGAFNSGTNLLSELMIANCYNKHRMAKYGDVNRGVRWQVPWGKHTPPGDEEHRMSHKTPKDKDINASNIIPAITIRDPYQWMQSMCRHRYTAKWLKVNHCPNLIETQQDIDDKLSGNLPRPVIYLYDFPVDDREDYKWSPTHEEIDTDGTAINVYNLTVRYTGVKKQHRSLIHFWNDWYNEYYDIDIPRIFVRYEDLVFFPKQVITTVCECFGGSMKTLWYGKQRKFEYVVQSAKKGKNAHGSVRTGYIDSLIKYGTNRTRFAGFQKQDLVYATKNMDPKLMQIFNYKYWNETGIVNDNNEEDDDDDDDDGDDAEPKEEGVQTREEHLKREKEIYSRRMTEKDLHTKYNEKEQLQLKGEQQQNDNNDNLTSYERDKILRDRFKIARERKREMERQQKQDKQLPNVQDTTTAIEREKKFSQPQQQILQKEDNDKRIAYFENSKEIKQRERSMRERFKIARENTS